MFALLSVTLLLSSYLLGAIASAVWLSKSMYGVDIRTLGSFNAGSTNMFRMLGFKAGLATQIIDILKGSLAAALPWFFHWLLPEQDHFMSHWTLEMQSMACGMLAVIGHIYPIFAEFRGGKGVNTLLGMMLITNPLASIFCLLAWLITLYLTRYIALASIFAVATYPIFLFLQHLISANPPDWPLLSLGLLMFLLVVFTHRANIRLLLNGEEVRNTWFDHKKKN